MSWKPAERTTYCTIFRRDIQWRKTLRKGCISNFDINVIMSLGERDVYEHHGTCLITFFSNTPPPLDVLAP